MKKTTLITGAGRGIGLEIAKIFASKNENLILIIRKNNQKKIIEKIIKNYNCKFKIFVGDLNNLNFVRKIGKQVKYVTTIINNASGENQKYFTDVTEKDLTKMINVNLIAYIILTKTFKTTAASHMLKSYVPCFNATVIDKIKKNGAILIGKTKVRPPISRKLLLVPVSNIAAKAPAKTEVT